MVAGAADMDSHSNQNVADPATNQGEEHKIASTKTNEGFVRRNVVGCWFWTDKEAGLF